ncbi:hypothetical protein [Microcoleus vaginatus]|uniref:hypothetical protein n=1 Tax=Microcoleus vaginatus TaxID=119532 RepID=UPI001F6236C3
MFAVRQPVPPNSFHIDFLWTVFGRYESPISVFESSMRVLALVLSFFCRSRCWAMAPGRFQSEPASISASGALRLSTLSIVG